MSTSLSPRTIGHDGFSHLALSDGIVYRLTPCCEASSKGSGDGVVCRACYQPLDTKYGEAWLEADSPLAIFDPPKPQGPPALPVSQEEIEEACQDRNLTIKALRKALKARTGRSWSVTGGRGTAWGWITIQAPPARQDGYSTSEEDREILGQALGERVGHQGAFVPASQDHRREILEQAHGLAVSQGASQYWD